MKKQSLTDYEIGNLYDLDFLKAFENLNDIKEHKRKCSLQKYRKSYVNSLFTPLCSYSIEYLNNNDENIGIIGKSTVSGTHVIYTILNKAIYDLFFQREKGKIFVEVKTEINYKIKFDEENYYEPKINYDEKYSFEELLNIISLGEIKDPLIDLKVLKDVFYNKKREIISNFRFDCTTQERIMNAFISNSNKEIKELPNVIFFEKNNFKKTYVEIGRIITVEEQTTISNFLVYLETEFKNGKEVNKNSFIKGRELILPKNSCNFIEIKTSVDDFKGKYNKNEHYITPLEISSINEQSNVDENISNSKIIANQIMTKMIEFIDLYNNINIKYSQINLIIIVDSFFTHDFIDIAEKFSENLIDNDKLQDFNLFFVHIESQVLRISERNIIKNLEKNIKIKEEEINMLKDDLTAKTEEINKLKNESTQLKIYFDKKLNEYKNKDRMRKIKKKLRNLIYDEILNQEIQKDQEEIEKDSTNNYIIGNYKNNSFQNIKIKKLNSIKNKFNVILDFQTFIRLDYTEKNFDLINDIKEKHLEKIKIFSKKEVNKLILVVDFIFVLLIKEIKENYFKNKAITIKPITVKSQCLKEENIFYIISFENSNSNSIIFKDDIILYNEIDIQKISDVNNFIRFYYELKNIDPQKDLEDFPIYEPITEKSDLYIDIRKTDCKNGKIIALIVESFYNIEDLNLGIYENSYTYIILLYQGYFFDFPKEKCQLYSKYFLKNENSETIILSPGISSVMEENNIYLGIFDDVDKCKAVLIDEKNFFILFKFKLLRKNESDNIEIENYKLNTNNIIDKNIKIIMEKLKFTNNKNFNVLIDEPFNIINNYVKSNYKKLKITLLSKENNKNIKSKISTTENNEINGNILSYLINNENDTFNIIISVYPTFDIENNIKLINEHLKQGGVFCFYMFSKNKYLMEGKKKEIEDVFNVSLFFNHSYYIFICAKKSE